MDIKLLPVLERMREMQRTAEAFNAPISMSAVDYKAVADEIERLKSDIARQRETITALQQRCWDYARHSD